MAAMSVVARVGREATVARAPRVAWTAPTEATAVATAQTCSSSGTACDGRPSALRHCRAARWRTRSPSVASSRGCTPRWNSRTDGRRPGWCALSLRSTASRRAQRSRRPALARAAPGRARSCGGSRRTRRCSSRRWGQAQRWLPTRAIGEARVEVLVAARVVATQAAVATWAARAGAPAIRSGRRRSGAKRCSSSRWSRG